MDFLVKIAVFLQNNKKIKNFYDQKVDFGLKKRRVHLDFISDFIKEIWAGYSISS